MRSRSAVPGRSAGTSSRRRRDPRPTLGVGAHLDGDPLAPREQVHRRCAVDGPVGGVRQEHLAMDPACGTACTTWSNAARYAYGYHRSAVARPIAARSAPRWRSGRRGRRPWVGCKAAAMPRSRARAQPRTRGCGACASRWPRSRRARASSSCHTGLAAQDEAPLRPARAERAAIRARAARPRGTTPRGREATLLLRATSPRTP